MSQLEFDFAVAVFSDYDADGRLEIQHDAPGIGEAAGTVPDEAVMPGGFMHRPLDPEKDAGGQPTTGAGLLRWTHGDHRHSMPLSDDERTIPKLPKLRKGGTGMYGGAGEYRTFVVIDGVDPDGIVQAGSLTAMTPYAKDGVKKSHVFSMLVRERGQEAVVLTHGEGQGFTATTTGKRAAMMKNAAGNASVMANDDGVAIAGKTKIIGTLTVGEPNAAQELVLAKVLIAYLTALEARIAATPGVLPPPPGTSIAQIATMMTTRFLKGM